MKQANESRISSPSTAEVEPSQAIRRLAAAIALHAERSSGNKAQPWDASAKPAFANRAKLAESLARLPMT